MLNLISILIAPVVLEVPDFVVDLLVSNDPPGLVVFIGLYCSFTDSQLHTTVVVEVIEKCDGISFFLLSTVTDQPLLLKLVFGDLIG